MCTIPFIILSCPHSLQCLIVFNVSISHSPSLGKYGFKDAKKLMILRTTLGVVRDTKM